MKHDPIFRSSRTFLLALAGLLTLAAGPAQAKINDAPVNTVVGPVVGDVSAESAVLWLRPIEEGLYTLVITSSDPKFRRELTERANMDNDLCIHWYIYDLAADTKYSYEITYKDKPIVSGNDYFFQTAPADGQPARVCLALGSCAWSEPAPGELRLPACRR